MVPDAALSLLADMAQNFSKVADAAHPSVANVAHSLAADAPLSSNLVGTQTGSNSKVCEGPCSPDYLPATAMVGNSNLGCSMVNVVPAPLTSPPPP